MLAKNQFYFADVDISYHFQKKYIGSFVKTLGVCEAAAYRGLHKSPVHGGPCEDPTHNIPRATNMPPKACYSILFYISYFVSIHYSKFYAYFSLCAPWLESSMKYNLLFYAFSLLRAISVAFLISFVTTTGDCGRLIDYYGRLTGLL